jgi:acetylglutamate kinase
MTPSEKASVFHEALPYLQEFRGQTFVIKYGGSAMENDALIGKVLRDVVMLEAVGINPVIVHGGGKAINRALKEANLGNGRFIDGLRVTDAATIQIVDRTLGSEISPSIAARLRELGGRAEALSGKDVLRAEKMNYHEATTGKAVDLGFVGDITQVDVAPLKKMIANETIPVISPLALGAKGEVYNINADLAASDVAKALQACKLIYLTDVNGVMRDAADSTSTIPTLTPAEVTRLKKSGVIAGGMIPKVDSAVEALESGVGQVHFLDGRIPHALLLEIFTDAGIGTEFRK